MTNLEFTIHLNTPLIQAETKTRFECILRIRGKVVSQEPNGFLILVKSLGTEKEWHDANGSMKKIFLPIHKIDYMAIE